MNRRTLEACRTIAALPDDGWNDPEWDSFLSAQSVLAEEVGRIDRREARKPAPTRKLQGRPLRSRNKRDAEWEGARAAMLERAGNVCEVRGERCTVRAVHVHHRLMRSQGGGHELDNLLAVCAADHDDIHANPERSYALGWLLHREKEG